MKILKYLILFVFLTSVCFSTNLFAGIPKTTPKVITLIDPVFVYREKISEDIRGTTHEFLFKNDFSKSFDPKHYLPLLDQLRSEIENYINTVNTDENHKIVKLGVYLFGPPDPKMPPTIIRVILIYFDKTMWDLQIHIPANFKRRS